MATTTSVGSIQQTIPTELMPYFTQKESKKGAGDMGILERARQLTTRTYADTYGDALDKAGLSGSGRIAGLSPMQEAVGADLQNLGLPSGYSQANSIYSGMTDPNQTSKYMNPYLQLALQPQIEQATRNARVNSIAQDRGAARAGSYGGARNILAQQEANKNLQTQLGNITATGYSNAFDNAQKTQLAQAQGLGSLAQSQNAANLQNIAAKGAYGDLQRAIQQQQLDTQYSDLMRKQDFPMEQVGNMANLLRGVPIVQTGGTQVTQTPPPSFASQLTGLLTAGYGMSRGTGP